MTLTRIIAKWPGKCAASGQSFGAGAEVLHDAEAKRCYLPEHAPPGAEVQGSVEEQMAEAYERGRLAGAPDAPPTICPYTSPSALAHRWHQGVDDARTA